MEFKKWYDITEENINSIILPVLCGINVTVKNDNQWLTIEFNNGLFMFDKNCRNNNSFHQRPIKNGSSFALLWGLKKFKIYDKNSLELSDGNSSLYINI